MIKLIIFDKSNIKRKEREIHYRLKLYKDRLI